MNADEVRAATDVAMAEVADWDSSYVTDELLQTDEESAVEVAEDEAESKALPGTEEVRAVYYGNHPAFVRDTSRPGYVGKLFFSNGAVNRPNDPCEPPRLS